MCSMHAVINRMISGTSLSPAGSIESCIAMFYTRNGLTAIDLGRVSAARRRRFQLGNPTPVRRLLKRTRSGVRFNSDLDRLHLRQPFHANVFEIPDARMIVRLQRNRPAVRREEPTSAL